MYLYFTENVKASSSKKAVQKKTKNRGEITGDDIKHIFKKCCNITNEVLELKEELSQAYENHSKMVQELYEKKIECIALEHKLEKEDERCNHLKDYVDHMNKPPHPVSLMEFDEQESISQENDGTLQTIFHFTSPQ